MDSDSIQGLVCGTSYTLTGVALVLFATVISPGSRPGNRVLRDPFSIVTMVLGSLVLLNAFVGFLGYYMKLVTAMVTAKLVGIATLVAQIAWAVSLLVIIRKDPEGKFPVQRETKIDIMVSVFICIVAVT